MNRAALALLAAIVAMPVVALTRTEPVYLIASPDQQCASTPAPETSRPESAPAPESPPYETVYSWDGGYAGARLGVGFLRPDRYEWIASVSVPIFSGPDTAQVGWISDGWVHRVVAGNATRRPYTYRGTVETDYEMASPLVLEAKPDGWIRFRYDAPSESDDGTAWTHECHLGLGETPLELVLWRDLFSGEASEALFFRSPERHALRAGPSAQQDLIMWIEEDDDFEAVEIQGEWMRVHAYHPGKFFTVCTTGENFQGEPVTGWIRWFSDEKGPWIWYPTRGC